MTATASELNKQRFWKDKYNPASPPNVLESDGNLWDLLDLQVQRFAARPAINWFGAETTYRVFGEQVDRVAQGLVNLGVKHGDRVAIVMPNAPHGLISLYACWRIGAIAVQHNPTYTADELQVILSDHTAKVAIVWDKLVPLIQGIQDETSLEQIVAVDVTTTMPAKLQLMMRLPVRKARESREKLTVPASGAVPFAKLMRSKPIDRNHPAPKTDDIAVLSYTSGTTGKPKGVMLSHGNLISNARMCRAIMPNFIEGMEIQYLLLPMFHSFGLVIGPIVGTMVGALMVPFPTFDADLLIDANKHTKATFIVAVPPMFDRMARLARDGKLDLSTVRHGMSGAMTLPDAVVKRWEEVAGGMLNEGYGLTEASPIVSANPFVPWRKIGTIGLPFASTDIKVVDPDENDREVELGKPGELLVKGPQVFKGYWNMPEETKKSLTDDGWLRTGDIVEQDDEGFMKVVDRRKELIITGGFNVAPTEVEQVLIQVPGIAEAAVVGIARGSSGAESVTAAVVLEEGAEFDEEATRAFAREHLADYKLPRSYVVWEELPKSLIGKVLRRQVRETLQKNPKATRAETTED